MMAKRSRPWVGKADAVPGWLCAKPTGEMSPDLATDHQGQQDQAMARNAKGAAMHSKAGYETAVDPPRQKLAELACHMGGVHISTAGHPAQRGKPFEPRLRPARRLARLNGSTRKRTLAHVRNGPQAAAGLRTAQVTC